MVTLISAVIGALVGAGFASGRELVTFFAAFGAQGMVGVLLMTGLFTAGCLLLLGLCDRLDLDSYEALLAAIFPPFWAKVFTVLVSVGLWLGLGMMLSGCGTLGAVLLGWPVWLGFVLALAGTYWPLSRDSEGFLRLNGWLIPIMVVFAAVMALVFLARPLSCAALLPQVQLVPNWPIAAILYWLYNSLLSMAVLVGIRRKKHVRLAVAAGALVIGALALLLCACLTLLPETLQETQMPMLTLAQVMGGFWKICYGIVMILAMYTTALANCYGLVVNYEYHITHRKTLLLLILLPTVLFGPFDFGRLVSILYPLLGYASAPIMVGMLIKAAKLLTGSGGRL